jgi:hypothetical protein
MERSRRRFTPALSDSEPPCRKPPWPPRSSAHPKNRLFCERIGR